MHYTRGVLRAFRWYIARVRHFAGGAQLRPYRPIYQVFMHHTRGVLRELDILRAEQGGGIYASAPTEHHRKFIPPTDHHRKFIPDRPALLIRSDFRL